MYSNQCVDQYLRNEYIPQIVVLKKKLTCVYFSRKK